ncbi:MAG: metallophosphoesterase [Deltaproteobacteria bacterium]
MQIAWLNVIVFCALTMGHAALIVAIVNRVHGWPLPVRVLHRVRQGHDLVIVILPVAFACLAGFRGPRLFFGGSWHELSFPLLVYLAVCGAVALALPAVAVYRRLAGSAELQIGGQSTEIDLARELGFRPVGRGPYRLFTHVPGNEFLKLEASDKEYRLPRLPTAWNGLSILHLSDLHFIGTIERIWFERVIRIANTMPADLVVFTGDLLDREDLVEWIPATLGQLRAPLGCYFVLGNHDSYLTNTDRIRARLEDLGWHSLAGGVRVIDCKGRPLVICGSELPWMGTQPDLSAAPTEAFRLFLSHTPDNVNWACSHNIDLMLSGHNHGGQVRLPGFGPVYSPSIYGCHYASGVFWEPPTLLYVSRGISGKHPLRWNCLPELTRLILRPALAEASADGRVATETAEAPAAIAPQMAQVLADE